MVEPNFKSNTRSWLAQRRPATLVNRGPGIENIFVPANSFIATHADGCFVVDRFCTNMTLRCSS